ncbi:MAG TPA: sterol desaturase family protein [Rhodoblastus sp.]|nr:sterol desaturase family protein [Rhodoblastus sp.]
MIEFTNHTLIAGRVSVAAVAVGLMALEFGLSRFMRRKVYDARETTASLAIALVHGAIRAGEAALRAVPLAFVYRHRLFDMPLDAAGILGLFLLGEFFYSWRHRAGHRIAWLWASHAVHHSAGRLNLSSAVRLGWTGGISGGFLFLLPIVWPGYPPLAVLAMVAANLAYQFVIHVDAPIRLGPLEWIFNTPAHHRVHHGANPACLDRNYGGVLIVFDRLYGTFAQAPKDEPLRFGVAGAARSDNPFRINFREWAVIYSRARRGELWRRPARPVWAADDRKRRESMKRILFAAGVCLLVAPALAQNPMEMMRIRSACQADASAFCGGVKPGGGRILACLQGNQDKLSASCRSVLPEAEKLKNDAQAAGKLPK